MYAYRVFHLQIFRKIERWYRKICGPERVKGYYIMFMDGQEFRGEESQRWEFLAMWNPDRRSFLGRNPAGKEFSWRNPGEGSFLGGISGGWISCWESPAGGVPAGGNSLWGIPSEEVSWKESCLGPHHSHALSWSISWYLYYNISTMV